MVDNKNKKKVMVGMSGGVDSSVAAHLLTKEYDICGVTLKLFNSENDNNEACDSQKSCCSLSDVLDAKEVCRKMNIDHFVFNFKDEFGKLVIDKFIETYKNGGTPNPCIDCNRYVKFYKMMERALTLGYDYIATGHYARIEYSQQRQRFLLKKAVDLSKDQSYVLYTLTQDELSHLILPLGELEKTNVRKIADENGFVNAHKPDSQDICFVPDGDYSAFIKEKTGISPKTGNFIDLNGTILGEHKGLISYTTGQRKGLGIAYKHPLYVIKKDLTNNNVVVGNESDLFSDTLFIGDM
ncbi:MAG: tRNA 2-thiouridine(34) synthase MnmA, partial [Oscillospiraceae bacterium]